MIDSARTDLTETYLQMNFRNGNFITTNLIENLSYFFKKMPYFSHRKLYFCFKLLALPQALHQI